MGKIRSLDFVLLMTSVFGINQGYTGRYLAPNLTWIPGIFNASFTLTVGYLIISGDYLKLKSKLVLPNILSALFYYIQMFVVFIIQIRCLFRRGKITPIGKELAHLEELSTWDGELFPCIARNLIQILSHCLLQILPFYHGHYKGWQLLTTCFHWINCVPTVWIEFLGQAMMLFQHELKELRRIVEGMSTSRDYTIETLRSLNRRHVSLIVLANKLARSTGMDNLLIIETERLLMLLNIFLVVNYLNVYNSVPWYVDLLNGLLYYFRMERIAHCCFRGYRLALEASRFESTLDEIDSLALENEQAFTEFQIIRKQVKLRKLHFDCNRLLKLDMLLILYTIKDLIAFFIILVQLSTGTAKRAINGTEASNVTLEFLDFQSTVPIPSQ